MRYRLNILAVMLALAWPCFKVEAQSRPGTGTQINSVDHRFETEPPMALTESPLAGRMPKFMNERMLTKEVFTIQWQTSAAGVEPGALLLFEYEQKFAKGIKNLQVKYPFEVKGLRQTAFVIPGKNVKAGGEVTRWRVRLVFKGRLLAEKKSSSWKS
ncbi:MAG: hypothetical protein V2A34_01725 [Lentisphaerota bacterium]